MALCRRVTGRTGCVEPMNYAAGMANTRLPVINGNNRLFIYWLVDCAANETESRAGVGTQTVIFSISLDQVKKTLTLLKLKYGKYL